MIHLSRVKDEIISPTIQGSSSYQLMPEISNVELSIAERKILRKELAADDHEQEPYWVGGLSNYCRFDAMSGVERGLLVAIAKKIIRIWLEINVLSFLHC